MATCRVMLRLFMVVIGSSNCVARCEEALSDHSLVSSQLEKIDELIEAGDANAVIGAIAELEARLDLPEKQYLERARLVKMYLQKIMWSPVAKLDTVNIAAAKLALHALRTATFNSLADGDLLEQHLEIVLVHLPRTSLNRHELAMASLQVWNGLEVATVNADTELKSFVVLDVPVPGPEFKGRFFWGMKPDAIKDSEFRDRYVAYLQNQAQYSVLLAKYRHLTILRDRYIKRLKEVLKVAYPDDEAGHAKGLATIEEHISNPEVRSDLLRIVRRLDAEVPADRIKVQADIKWIPARDPTTGPINTLTLSVPARKDAVIVRGRFRSQFLPVIEAIANEFPSGDKLQIAYDDHSSLGWFCDPTAPFDVLVHEGRLTAHDQRSLSRSFPPDSRQPEVVLVGQRRVYVVVHKSNPISSLSLVGMGKILGAAKEGSNWSEFGGGRIPIRCYGPLDGTWPRSFVRQRCMNSWRDTEQPGIRQQQIENYRDDIVPCADGKEVISKVRADRNAMGFFAWDEQLNEEDFASVKILSIADEAAGPPVRPSIVPEIEQFYPLAESVTLYAHPSAPLQAHLFCEFAAGPEAAKIARQMGLWTPIDVEQRLSAQRLEDAKAGLGESISVLGLVSSEKLARDLALEYVEASEVVQLNFQRSSSEVSAIERYLSGSADLLILEREPPSSLLEFFDEHKRCALGQTALGVIVHPELPADSFSLDDLQIICRRQIKKWPGGSPITGYGLPFSEPVMQIYQQHLAPPPGAGTGSLRLTAHPSTIQVMAAVARDPAGIGFVDLYDLPQDHASVRLLGIVLDKDTVVQPAPGFVPENYPLVNHYVLYESPTAGEAAKKMAAWLAEHPCEEVLKQHHLIAPLRPEATTTGPLPEALAVAASNPNPENLVEQKTTVRRMFELSEGSAATSGAGSHGQDVWTPSDASAEGTGNSSTDATRSSNGDSSVLVGFQMPPNELLWAIGGSFALSVVFIFLGSRKSKIRALRDRRS